MAHDFDWEVKLRAVRLLHFLLMRCFGHVSNGTSIAGQDHSDAASDGDEDSSEQMNAASALFLDFEGDRLLSEALKDHERMVRLETASLLSSVLTGEGTEVSGGHTGGTQRIGIFLQHVRGAGLDGIIRQAGPHEEEDEDEFLTRHINAPSGAEADEHFPDCPF